MKAELAEAKDREPLYVCECESGFGLHTSCRYLLTHDMTDKRWKWMLHIKSLRTFSQNSNDSSDVKIGEHSEIA